MTKDEALRFADELEASVSNPHLYWQGKAAEKIRSLYAANIDCVNHFEALKADYDALKAVNQELLDSLQACEKALAQPKPEPVAWMDGYGNIYSLEEIADGCLEASIPLYTHPKEWQDLTDDEIIDVIHPIVIADMPDEATDYEISRAIEAKLKKKNA